MPDTFTNHLRLVDQTTGGNDGTWGDIADANFGKIDAKAGAKTNVATVGGTYVLSESEERVNFLNVTGVLVADATIEFSGRGGAWVLKNGTTGNFTLTCKVTGQTGIVVTQGETVVVYSTLTDIAKAGGVDGALTFLSAPVTVASSATADVLGAASIFVTVTGTTGISSFGTGANRLKFVRFQSALTLTHSSALACPGAVNLVLAAGDQIIVMSDVSSNARIVSVLRLGGAVTNDLANSAVTYAKIQNVSATDKVLGRSTAGAGVVEEIPLTPVARTLVAQTTQALMRSTGLGLGDLATQDQADLGYTGGSASNTSYPVGEMLLVHLQTTINRNGADTIRIDSGNTYGYTNGAIGTIIPGTWRSRGMMDVSGGTMALMRRVA